MKTLVHMRTLFFLTLIVTITCSSVVAQTDTRMITFESSTSRRNTSTQTPEMAKNSLSLGLASFMSGYNAVYYERAIVGPISLRLGAGITYRNFVADLIEYTRSDGEKSTYFVQSDMIDIADNYSQYGYRKARPGYCLSVAPKLYIEDNMDGFYVAPVFEIKNYRYTAQKADETAEPTNFNFYDVDGNSIPRTSAAVNEKASCMDVTLNCGGHYQTEKNVVIGWNFGFGIRQASVTRGDTGVTTDPSSQMRRFKTVARDYSSTRFLMCFNFIVGGCF